MVLFDFMIEFLAGDVRPQDLGISSAFPRILPNWYWIRHHIKVGMHVMVENLGLKRITVQTLI